ncbi:hypothetical protein AAG895_05975 [Thauera sp. JM12B12]|uniref:hypothetical protein n=1 Tax=Thauera sp. JM12B12 TaxID=3142262 RepID=UPI0031F416AD
MSTNHCETSRQSDSTTTTKHPHLSVVQFFKEPLHSLQQRSEIMISYPTTVKHLANLFLPPPRNKPETLTRTTPASLLPPPPPRLPKNRCSAEEVRIIDTQKTTSRKKKTKKIYGGTS